MKATELLVLPTLTWGVQSSHRELQPDEQLALQRLGFLISAYEPAYWYYELVEAIRKILLISLLPLVTTDGATSLLWASFLLNFAALLFTFSLRPYVDPTLDR